ncbi:MAG: hypothetical protein COB02_01275 [Candidatus Cloacimonadota bacterium]|nr:MAG: hypothetical protein COB02_01275 [Candidatus Cloacimonadota bacterium]
MRYYIIEPEVSISLGEGSVLSTATHPPTIEKLDLIFEGWLGDDILETFPCFFVTEKLKRLIQFNNLSQVEFEEISIIKSDALLEFNIQKKIPKIYLLKISGEAKINDFGVSKDNLLIVSELCLKVLKQSNVNHCDIEEIS